MRKAIGLALVFLLAACGAPAADAPREVKVFAASSLSEAFKAFADGFTSARPGVKLIFNFAGSSTLVQQINNGAPADVLATANPETMRQVNDAIDPKVFVRNQLVIAVAKGNPLGIRGLADLARPGLKVALCAEQVPCGAAAKKALAGYQVTPVTLEQDVKAALSKVALGEVDAALVYGTDAKSSAKVEGVAFPESAKAINDYPIAVLRNANHRADAEAFAAYVFTGPCRQYFAGAGFVPAQT